MNENNLLDVLTREGVLINVTVRYWRATKKLKPEDLGLDPGQVAERWICLGHKKLLPKEALGSFALIEGRAHALIEAGTFPFLQGLSHFLPNAKLQEVTDKLNGLAGEFNQARAEFLEHYAGMRQDAVQEWLLAAQRLVPDPDRLVATIEASFPPSETMERFFGFATQLFQIRVPEELDLRLVTVREQQEILRVREEAARVAREQIGHGVESFVSDCVGMLRQQTAQICEEMLASMQSGKIGVHQKTLNRLIKFIDEFKKLNFVGDRQMEEALERVRREFLTHSAEGYRNNEVARVRLQQGLRALSETARGLAQQDTREIVERFGSMGQRKFHLAA